MHSFTWIWQCGNVFKTDGILIVLKYVTTNCWYTFVCWKQMSPTPKNSPNTKEKLLLGEKLRTQRQKCTDAQRLSVKKRLYVYVSCSLELCKSLKNYKQNRHVGRRPKTLWHQFGLSLRSNGVHQTLINISYHGHLQSICLKCDQNVVHFESRVSRYLKSVASKYVVFPERQPQFT